MADLLPAWLPYPSGPEALDPRVWSSTARRDGARIAVGGVDLPALAGEVNTPVFVLDEADFRARARAFRDAFAGVDVYYAGKAFLCVEVARWVREEGLKLDVCSPGELSVALRAGVAPADIGYHGNNKTAMELRRAATLGVGRIVVDSFDEIERVRDLAAELGGPIRVMVRVTVGVHAGGHEFISTAHEDQKFGFSLAAGHALEAAARLHAIPGVELLGYHAHIGSQIFDTEAHALTAGKLLALTRATNAALGVTLAELDLGGGYGIAYTEADEPLSAADIAAQVLEAVAREAAELGMAVPRLSIEPGRAIVGPTTCTVYAVGTVKRVPLEDGDERLYVSVDGGMSDNIRTALYDAAYTATLANRVSSAPGVAARVVGKHCESGDIVVRDVLLPEDVAPGDLLAVPATGAYGRSMASNYNLSLRPPVVAVKDGRFRVIVRRETEDDLFATDLGFERGTA